VIYGNECETKTKSTTPTKVIPPRRRKNLEGYDNSYWPIIVKKKKNYIYNFVNL